MRWPWAAINSTGARCRPITAGRTRTRVPTPESQWVMPAHELRNGPPVGGWRSGLVGGRRRPNRTLRARRELRAGSRVGNRRLRAARFSVRRGKRQAPGEPMRATGRPAVPTHLHVAAMSERAIGLIVPPAPGPAVHAARRKRVRHVARPSTRHFNLISACRDVASQRSAPHRDDRPSRTRRART